MSNYLPKIWIIPEITAIKKSFGMLFCSILHDWESENCGIGVNLEISLKK